MKALLLVFAITMVGCSGPAAQLSLTHLPRFSETTCVPAVPVARAGYPTTDWAWFSKIAVAMCALPRRGGLDVSLLDYMMTFTSKRGASSDDLTFQRIAVKGLERRTDADCGDTPVPLIIPPTVELFKAPAYDVQARYICCEEMMSETTSAEVGIVKKSDLPARVVKGLPTIPRGKNAAFIDITSLTTSQRQQIRDEMDSNRGITWSHTWSYDGCHPPPNSTNLCGNGHCLKLKWKDIYGEKNRHFSGP